MVLTTLVDLAKTCKDQGFILKGNGDGSARLERSSYYQEFL
jgi:hypothetical protein